MPDYTGLDRSPGMPPVSRKSFGWILDLIEVWEKEHYRIEFCERIDVAQIPAATIEGGEWKHV